MTFRKLRVHPDVEAVMLNVRNGKKAFLNKLTWTFSDGIRGKF